MFGHSVFIFSLWATYFCTVNSAKILVVVPVPSISHQVVFRPLIQELINRNHEVTFITTDPMYPRDKLPINLHEIDVHDLSYDVFNKMLNDLPKNNHRELLLEMTFVYEALSRLFEKQLKHKSVQELLINKTERFDLLIVEACCPSALIFSYIFKAPLILMSSFGPIPGNMEAIGAATHPVLYPTPFNNKIYNLTYLEKIAELYNQVAFYKMFQKQAAKDHKMLQSIFGDDVPPLDKLKNNVDMMFFNVHPIWLHNQPVPPNVIFTWGIHKVPEKLLPEDIQSYLDSAVNGAIYVSFGTNVKPSRIGSEKLNNLVKVFSQLPYKILWKWDLDKLRDIQSYLDSAVNGAIYVSFGTNVKPSTIGSEKLNILVKVFSQLPYKILWKWDLDELPGISDNIKISKWFPQVDVLRHPNVKLFITQGGLQSTDEAINAGLPLIGIPMYADQAYNTAKYEHFKIGMQLDFVHFTEDDLSSAVANIFTNYESYRKNIIKLRTQMQDQPKPPLENAIWWVEYVLRHGGAKHLRSPAANMPWTEYYELKLVLIVLSGVIVFGTFLIITIHFCYKYITRCLKLRSKNKVA